VSTSCREECVLVQRGVPRPCKVDSESEAELDTPFDIKCCCYGRFERQTDLLVDFYKRGNRLTTMIDIRLSPH
jgi:hypothetical protein